VADDVRVAIVGYGLAGQVFHAPLAEAAEGCRLVAVVTGDRERQALVRSRHPTAAVVPTVDELLAAADGFDLLVVATRNDSHVPIASSAVRLGKAVLVDKPLALTSASARDLVDLAAAAGVVLSVFQNRRWDSDQLTLRRLLDEGELGQVLRYESRFERWRPVPRAGSWREALSGEQGGGLLLDLGSHLVDQALHLFGPARRVYAEVEARRGESDDDDFVAIEHESGVRSQLWAGALAGSPGPRLRVLGRAGAYVVEGLDSQEDVLRERGALPEGGNPEPESAYGRLVRGDESRVVPSERGRWDLFYPRLADAVRGAGPVPVDPADAVAALTVLEAARRSAREAAVVTL
jgi:scyllo-inositol 2-dehydrogenase (NADP+)